MNYSPHAFVTSCGSYRAPWGDEIHHTEGEMPYKDELLSPGFVISCGSYIAPWVKFHYTEEEMPCER